MTLIDFEDAVTAGNLNPNSQYGVYYADGAFANLTAVRARLPHAKLYGITVFGRLGPDVFACDCERGDMSVPQAEAWVAAQVRLNVPLVCVYASLDVWEKQGLLNTLAKYGRRIKRWVAHYNNVAQIPEWADADQFADPGPVDRNVALANFFQGISPVIPPRPHGMARFEGTVDLGTGEWHIRGLPGRAHFAGPQEWMSAELQVDRGSDSQHGHWRIRGIPLNAAPLGR
jgi:hypothetical protein